MQTKYSSLDEEILLIRIESAIDLSSKHPTLFIEYSHRSNAMHVKTSLPDYGTRFPNINMSVRSHNLCCSETEIVLYVLYCCLGQVQEHAVISLPKKVFLFYFVGRP